MKRSIPVRYASRNGPQSIADTFTGDEREAPAPRTIQQSYQTGRNIDFKVKLRFHRELRRRLSADSIAQPQAGLAVIFLDRVKLEPRAPLVTTHSQLGRSSSKSTFFQRPGNCL